MTNRPEISPEITPELSLADQLLAAQDWWRDAGVDQVFHDEPTALLGEPEQPKRKAPPKQVAAGPSSDETNAPRPPAIDAATLPATLESFQHWWTDKSSIFPGASAQRIGPFGASGVSLMMIVPMPEEGDREALLSGPQGVLLNNILRALGLSADQTYFASALTAHTQMPNWDDLDQAGLATIIRHHIALAKPAKVLVFGSVLSQMLGMKANEVKTSLTLDSAQVPLLATRAPEHLLNNARQRARLWHNLLKWTET